MNGICAISTDIVSSSNELLYKYFVLCTKLVRTKIHFLRKSLIRYLIQMNWIDYLEHNLFKNVSNWVTLLWQTQIQTIKFVLDYTKRIKKKEVTYIALILYSFTTSDMNFQTILMPKVIFAKLLSQKIYLLGPFLSLSQKTGLFVRYILR